MLFERVGFSPFSLLEGDVIALYRYFIGVNIMETKELTKLSLP